MAVIGGFRSDLSITHKTDGCFVFQSRESANKIRYPSCILIVSLNRCSKPGTMSSLVKTSVKHITLLRRRHQCRKIGLGYHCTKRMQQMSRADVMSLFSVHKCYKLGPIFLRTVSMSTLYFHTAL